MGSFSVFCITGFGPRIILPGIVLGALFGGLVGLSGGAIDTIVKQKGDRRYLALGVVVIGVSSLAIVSLFIRILSSLD